MKINMNSRKLAKIAFTAALYAVATVFIAPLSYGVIQFRVSEVMTLLAFIDPIYIPGLVLGCALANLYSPLGMVDVVVGSFATFLSVYGISKTKNLFLASLWPTINCVFIGAELYFLQNAPFWGTTFYIALGEFAVVTCIGYPLFRVLLKRKDLIQSMKS